MVQATLWATVEAPTPPLAPTTAMTRPVMMVSEAENRLQIERHHVDGLDRPDHVVVDAAAPPARDRALCRWDCRSRPRGCRDRRHRRDRRGPRECRACRRIRSRSRFGVGIVS